MVGDVVVFHNFNIFVIPNGSSIGVEPQSDGRDWQSYVFLITFFFTVYGVGAVCFPHGSQTLLAGNVYICSLGC